MCLGNPQWRSQTSFTVPEEKSQIVTDFAVDVEGQGLYAIAGGLDANLFELDPNTGVLSFKDNAPDFENPLDSGADNTYNITVQFTDIRNAVVTRDITVNVTNTNDAPVITSDGGGENAVLDVSENQVAVTDVDATDNDGDDLVYSISGGDDADAFSIDEATGELTFNNAPDFEAPSDQNGDNMFHVDVTVTDSGGFDPASLNGRTFSQFGDNYYVGSTQKRSWADAQADAESIGGNLVMVDSAAEETFVQTTFQPLRIIWTGLQDIDGDDQVSNIDGSDVVYDFFNRNSTVIAPGSQSIAEAPQNSYRGSSAVALYDLWPNAAFGYSFNPNTAFNYVIEIDPTSDNFKNSDTQSLKINVTDKQANAVDDNVETRRETPIAIDVLVNDTGSQGSVLQIDGIGRQPINGTVDVNADGTITYTPNDGFSGGVDRFTYDISDGLGETGEATVTVRVNNQNTRPDAIDDRVTTAEDTPISIDVLSNDQDINNDNISIQSVGRPSNGTAQVVNGQVVYTPDQDFNGTDIFTYRIGDGKGGQDTAEIRVDVTPVNDNPVAVDDVRNIGRDQTIVINPVSNDTDVDGDTIELVTLASNPTKGAAFISQGGNVVYDPNPNATGMDSFDYEISDGNGGTDIGTIKINIGDGNPPANSDPNARNDSARTDIGIPITIDALGNDSDPENDPLTITDVADPTNGTATIVNGQVRYTPDDNFVGSDGFNYSVADGNGGTDTARITVTVQDNAPPDSRSIQGQVRNDLDADGDLNDADPGLAGITINLFKDFNNDKKEDRGGPVSTTTTGNDGTYNFDNLDAGTYIVKEVDPAGAVSTADSNGANPNRVVDVTVNDANPIASGIDFLDSFPGNGGNEDPNAVNDNATIAVGTPVNIDVLGNDSDPDNDPLTISDVENPDNGTAVVLNGQVRYIPDAGYTGMDIFNYTISDGNGGTDTAQIKVTVESNPGGGNGKIDIFGSNQSEAIRGTRASENIFGRGGKDKIIAGSGGDCVYGESGDDTLKGMGGNDTIEGGTGSDILYGGGGRDVLVGQQANNQGLREVDRFIGGAGKDVFVLGDENTFFYDLNGDRDYAKIEDFNVGDTLQLKGEADSYTTRGVGDNLYLYCKGDGALKADELIAVINDLDSLNLSGNQVRYV